MKKILSFVRLARDRQLASISLSRGAVATALRRVTLTDPLTWEMSVFSQNGEDGIIDVLLSQLSNRNKYFLEIGASTGLENNSSFLAVVHRYKGMMVEGSSRSSATCEAVIGGLCTKDVVKFVAMFVTKDTMPALYEQLLYKDPDVFSLDIDGNDYFIASALMSLGLRPKIVAVEFNSAFGPVEKRTIPYRDDFVAVNGHASGLYQGCSVALWREFYESLGYAFVCVESNGVNAFFVDRSCFDEQFVGSIRGLAFAENVLAHQRFQSTWQGQFERIKHLPYFVP